LPPVVRVTGRIRAAFTLLELLVLIAILALFIGLLLPAVEKVRAVAARINCSNNLKQMATAFRSHHDTHGHFPAGGTQLPPKYPFSADTFASTPKTRAMSWSWAYQILPYIGQEELFRNPDSSVLRHTPVKTFYCQARRSAQLYNGSAKIDYAGCAGDKLDGANGIVMRSTLGVVRSSDISDALGTTVMIGEKQLNRAMFGKSMDDNETYCTPGWDDWEVYRWGAAVPAPDFSKPGDITPSQVFGSAHTSGFNCAFADGSVRFIRYSVDPEAWRRACVRNDAEQVSPNNL